MEDVHAAENTIAASDCDVDAGGSGRSIGELERVSRLLDRVVHRAGGEAGKARARREEDALAGFETVCGLADGGSGTGSGGASDAGKEIELGEDASERRENIAAALVVVGGSAHVVLGC